MIVPTEVLKPTTIPGWVALGIMLLYAAIIFTKDEPAVTKDYVVLALGLLLTVGLFLIQRSCIILDNEGILHKQPGRERFIRYSDILFADLVTHYHGHGFSVNWHINTADGRNYRMLPYGKKNMRKTAEVLSMKLPPSALGKRVIKLAEGKRQLFF